MQSSASILSQIQTDLGLLLRITREKDIHLNLKSPFVIRLFGTYLHEVLVQVCPKQTEEAIHFVMEPGVCDLRMGYELHREFFRSQKHATFYSASVVCALQYLDGNGIVHGDVKLGEASA